MDSPILTLEPYIRAAAVLIAPERKTELDTLVSEKTLHLVLTDEVKDIAIDVDSGRVRLGLSALEHLWACALFYHCLYSDYAATQRTAALKFDVSAHPRTLTSMELLNWTIRQWKAGERNPWPSPLRPLPEPEEYSDSHCANELFLCALAWTVHHEYAHSILNHPNRELVNAQQEERDADLAAVDWIFRDAPTHKHLRKRALGVVIGILALDGLEFAQGDPSATSHPKAFERLAHCLNKYSRPDDDEAFAFALCGMQFNQSQRGVESALDGDSFRSILDEWLVARAIRDRR